MRRSGMLLSALCLLAVLSFVGAQSPTSVRFVAGTTSNFGIVEVTLSNGVVGRICDIGFDNNGASVICAMMGYRDLTGFKLSNLPAVTTGSPTPVMAVRTCPDFLATNPTTWTLASACQYVTASSVPTACNNRSLDVGVICTGTVTAGVLTTVTPNLATLAPTVCRGNVTNLRLSPGPDEGLVLIKDGSSPSATAFGTICASGFGVNEAATICRMLCQSTITNAIGITGKYLTDSATYPVMLSGLSCPAGANSTNYCTNNGWNVAAAGCTPSTAITVRCTAIDLAPPTTPRPTAICQANIAVVYFSVSDVSSSALLSLYGAYNSSTCSFTKGDNATTVWVSVPYTGCNSVSTFNATHVLYTMYIYKNVTLVDGVYKDTPYVVPVICAIPKISAVSAALAPDVRTVTPIYGGGDAYASEVRLFTTYSSGAFATEITPGQKLVVGSKIYARVQVTSPLVVQLTVRSCWASDRNDGTGKLYYMVQDKCASTDNSVFRIDAKTIGVNFVVVSFTGASSTSVYVFCNVTICTSDDADMRCQQICGTPSRRKRRSADTDVITDARPFNGPFQIVSKSLVGATSAAERTLAAAATAATFAAVVVTFVGYRPLM